jgi:hypothetical protein
VLATTTALFENHTLPAEVRAAAGLVLAGSTWELGDREAACSIANGPAIEAHNAHVQRDGVFSDGSRTFLETRDDLMALLA